MLRSREKIERGQSRQALSVKVAVWFRKCSMSEGARFDPTIPGRQPDITELIMLWTGTGAAFGAFPAMLLIEDHLMVALLPDHIT
jgi:hypothetical protein